MKIYVDYQLHVKFIDKCIYSRCISSLHIQINFSLWNDRTIHFSKSLTYKFTIIIKSYFIALVVSNNKVFSRFIVIFAQLGNPMSNDIKGNELKDVYA